MPFTATWMDPEIVLQSEVSHKEKKNHLTHTCGIQKNGMDELICKAGRETQMQKTNLWLTMGGREKKNNGRKGEWDELGNQD